MNSKCPTGVDKTELFDLRDRTLPPKQTERLQSHVQSCAECSAYLRDIARYHLLLRGTLHRAPQVQDHLWRDLRHRIVLGHKRSRIMSLSRGAVVRGMGIAAAAVALIVVFVQVIHYLESIRGNLATAQNSSQVTLDTSRAIKFTMPEQFTTFYVSPDGNTLIGEYIVANGNHTTTRIDSYIVSSGKLETLYAPPAGQAIGDPATDGRYLAWKQGPDSGPSNMNTLIVMDLQTKRITTVASKEDPSLAQGDLVPQVAHGSVFWQDLTFDSQYGNPQSGLIKMRDLATGVTKTLSTPGLAVNSDNNARGIGIGGTYGYLFTVDWPYVAFTVGNSPDTAREAVLDVTSGNVTPLSLPPAVHAAPSPHDIVYGMNGTTVIAGWFAVDGSMNFSQYHLSGSLQSWQPITTITDPSYIFVQDGGFEISDRFILFSAKTGNKTATLAWDRSLHLFFTAASFVNSSTGDVQLADIFGNWLVIATYHNNSQSTDYSLIDTTNLQLQTHG